MLPKPCDTRCLSRDSAIAVIDSCYKEIGTALYKYAKNSCDKAETKTKARGI